MSLHACIQCEKHLRSEGGHLSSSHNGINELSWIVYTCPFSVSIPYHGLIFIVTSIRGVLTSCFPPKRLQYQQQSFHRTQWAVCSAALDDICTCWSIHSSDSQPNGSSEIAKEINSINGRMFHLMECQYCLLSSLKRQSVGGTEDTAGNWAVIYEVSFPLGRMKLLLLPNISAMTPANKGMKNVSACPS